MTHEVKLKGINREYLLDEGEVPIVLNRSWGVQLSRSPGGSRAGNLTMDGLFAQAAPWALINPYQVPEGKELDILAIIYDAVGLPNLTTNDYNFGGVHIGHAELSGYLDVNDARIQDTGFVAYTPKAAGPYYNTSQQYAGWESRWEGKITVPAEQYPLVWHKDLIGAQATPIRWGQIEFVCIERPAE